MSEIHHCAECGAPLPAYWPQGLCAQCALDGALELTQAQSQVRETDATAAATSGPPTKLSAGNSPLGSFGEYDLIAEIARGGMGVVYKARQRNLDRLVAVKMILAGPLAGKEFVQRFRAEASAAAILQHPNIVAIHDVGVHEGRHYFSMDYIDGPNLAQLVGQQPLPPDRTARYVQVMAEAIQYAHERGILHRDLKPSNVLIDPSDQPRITDFGLAKRLDVESSLTLTGQVLGSPNFMPPEQAGARRGKVGRPTDVYALGGILYYLLTARAPFQADSLEHLITQVLNTEPVSPRLLNPSIPRDLETITLKCLEKEPSRRYQTAQELADELGRVLRREPIHSRPVNVPERLWRWGRRKPALASLIVVLHVVGAAGLAGIVWQWQRAERHAAAQGMERDRAERRAYASDMNLAHQALGANNLGRALELLNRHRPPAMPGNSKSEPANGRVASTRHPERPDDRRGWEWRYLWDQARSDELFTLCQKPIPILSVAVSPDAQFLAVGERNYGHLTVWDLQTRQEILRLPEEVRPDIVYIRAAFSPTEPLLAYGSASGVPPRTFASRVRLLNLQTRRQIAEFPLDFLASGIAFTSDGKLLVTSTAFTTTVWDVHSGEVRATHRVGSHQGIGNPFSMTPDGRLMAQAFEPDQQVRVFDLAAGKERWRTNAVRGSFDAVALSRDGRLLATSGADEESVICIWSGTDGRLLTSLDAFRGGVVKLMFGADDRTLISGNTDQTIRIWDVSNPASVPPPRALIGHTLEVWSLALMPDGKTLVSGGKDGSVRFWDLTRPPRQRGAQALAGGPFVNWSFSEDGSALLTCDRKGRITQWSGEAWQMTNTLLDADMKARRACFLPERQEVAIAGVDGALHVFGWGDSAATPRMVSVFGESDFSEWRWFLRRHGNRMAVGRMDQEIIHDFDVTTWEHKESWRGPGAFVTLDFSRDSRYCVMGGYRGQVLVRDMETGQVTDFVDVLPNIGNVAFSTLGDRVAISCEQGFARLWETGSWREAGMIGGFLHAVAGLGFSPDGARLAAGSGGRESIRVYDTDRHQPLLTLEADGVGFVPAFNANGDILAARNSAGRLHVWRAPAWQEIETALPPPPRQRP